MNYKNLSDEKIVEEVIKNREVFAEIIDRYQDKILRYIFYLVGNKKDAEDIAQEVFIKVYVNLLGFNKKLKFSSWLFRIAHNEAVNFLKKKKINLNFDERVYKVNSEKDIEEDFSKKELEKIVKNCLTELPFIYREIVDLYYFENLSYEEISDALKIPAGTVAIRLSRAKKLLKKICQDQKI